MQRDWNDQIEGPPVHIGKIEISQETGENRAAGEIAPVFEPVNRIEYNALIDQSGAGKSIVRFCFETVPAKMVSGGRIGENYAADRTAALGDEGEVLRAVPAEAPSLSGGQNVRTGDAQGREKRL